jgi:hypothetical protein
MSTSRHCEPARFLPPYLRDLLGRKSSRNPNSRFTTKLLLLLRYSDENPTLINQLGIAWLNDQEFKMNKSILVGVLGIKVNTLNINLRDLHFVQGTKEADGWTRWTCPGLNRNDFVPSGPLSAAAWQLDQISTITCAPGKSTVEFTLGQLGTPEYDPFLADSQRLWVELFATPVSNAVHPDIMIEHAANKFRHKDQPLDNAKEVIRAIIATRPDVPLTFQDFARFMAMFGPEATVMIKIASLLTCSNETGKWLTFDSIARVQRPLPFAQFDEKQPNCLVVHHGDQAVERAYNHPNLAAQMAYVLDESGAKFGDWDAYFKSRPVRQSYIAFPL